MKFYLYTGNKLERLAEKFISLVCGSLPADVFTPETVVVQTQGMAAWLKLRIGDSGRIAANFDTPFLVNFINRTLEAVFPQFRADFERFSTELRRGKSAGFSNGSRSVTRTRRLPVGTARRN